MDWEENTPPPQQLVSTNKLSYSGSFIKEEREFFSDPVEQSQLLHDQQAWTNRERGSFSSDISSVSSSSISSSVSVSSSHVQNYDTYANTTVNNTDSGLSLITAGNNGSYCSTDNSSVSSSSGSPIAFGLGGSRSRQLEELCFVCGDRSSGYHYNALTCEGCKAFFSRTVLRLGKPTPKLLKPCKFNGYCVQNMDMFLRRKCPSCRFQKCLQIGMLAECVLQPSSLSLSSDTQNPLHSPEKNPTTQFSIELTFEEKCLIQLLEANQEKYEKPSEESIRKLTENSDEICYKVITELTELTIILIVEFAKSLPGFTDLHIDTQCSLLQACCGDLMMLRAAKRYIIEKDCIEFANGLLFTRNSYLNAGVVSVAEPLFKFCQKLYKLELDNAEYAMLAAISIFSATTAASTSTDSTDQNNLSDSLETYQMKYVNLLRRYSEYKFTRKQKHERAGQKPSRNLGCVRFANLLAVLTEAHDLSIMNWDDCKGLICKGKIVPNLIIETYGLNVCNKNNNNNN